MTSGADLSMRALKVPPLHSCAHCGQVLKSMTWSDGDAFDVIESPSPYAAALFWGDCPSCERPLYLIELAIIPRVDERQFLNDARWEAEKTRLFEARSSAFPQPWLVIEYRKVSGVSVCEPDGSIETLDVPWLDLHIVAGWAAEDRAAAFEKARDLARSLLVNSGDLKERIIIDMLSGERLLITYTLS
jgi:hypothetical protein